MALTDKVETDRNNIIDMVACADDYGHANQITDGFFWKLLGMSLPDDEIAAYADDLLTDGAYGEEDREEVTDRLTDWRDLMAQRYAGENDD